MAHEFSVGDRIQFTAPDKSLGVANRDLAVIESIGPDGQISARLDNGRQIEFDATDHRHFDHGYAVTSHSAQGLTAERVLVNADTGVHPDLLNSRFGYVPVSRASHEASIFTDDANRLNQRLGTDVSKSSALAVEQTSPHRATTALRWLPLGVNGMKKKASTMPRAECQEQYEAIRAGIVDLLKSARSAAPGM